MECSRGKVLMAAALISHCSRRGLSFMPGFAPRAPPACSQEVIRATIRSCGVRRRRRVSSSMPHERECSRRLLLSMSAAEPSADGLSTATVSHHQTPTDSHAEDETPLPLDRALEEGVNRALRGDTAVLRQVVGNQVAWRGPMGNFAGLTAVEGELRGVGQLLREPRWTVFKAVGGVLEWVASGTWPLPWLPRFIVRGKSVVKTGADGKIAAITDNWEGNLVSLALQHLVPRFWDIWHQLASPVIEKQPYRVQRRTLSYEIRELAPRMVVQPSLIDRSNSRDLRMALILPNFCHTGELRTTGRRPDEYYVTGPVEVAIQPFIETSSFPNGTWFNGTVKEASTSRRANRITWTVPVPTAFGLDSEAMPSAARNPNDKEGEMARVDRQGFRTMAVTSFNGFPQDVEAAEVRSKLLAALATDGVEPKKGEDGRILNGILMHNTRACFNKKGQLSMSILEYRPKFIGIGNEVFVELSGRGGVNDKGD